MRRRRAASCRARRARTPRPLGAYLTASAARGRDAQRGARSTTGRGIRDGHRVGSPRCRSRGRFAPDGERVDVARPRVRDESAGVSRDGPWLSSPVAPAVGPRLCDRRRLHAASQWAGWPISGCRHGVVRGYHEYAAWAPDVLMAPSRTWTPHSPRTTTFADADAITGRSGSVRAVLPEGGQPPAPWTAPLGHAFSAASPGAGRTSWNRAPCGSAGS
jgi:hypothetical protein